MRTRERATRWLLAGALVLGVMVSLSSAAASPAAAATSLPAGFQEQIVFAGLNKPTNLEFSPDGRIFVAEQGGVIKVFDSLSDTTPTVFADLSVEVNSYWDHGLLGLALAPNFPTNPWVYALYTYDAPPGQTAPIWYDNCTASPSVGCPTTGRLVRLQAAGNTWTGNQQILVHDWCQQFPSHSIGDLRFATDGSLYVTGGDGASFLTGDYGQFGNPCGDAPGGTNLSPPTAEGGALRAQDVRTTGDAASLDGAVLRLDPNTGNAMAGNPLAASPDVNAKRVVAAGLRNPFRFALRPGTNEVWVGDVGADGYEEINRLVNPQSSVVNFGWPCYEGPKKWYVFEDRGLNLCDSLYQEGSATAPYFSWSHYQPVSAQDTCLADLGESSVSGMAFYPNEDGYPAEYRGALFFADYSRGCLWVMKPDTPGGLPNPAKVETFVGNAAAPVDLAIGPGNEVYYADLNGTVRRIRYFAGNQPPTAVISASTTGGALPLTVTFDATGSSDSDPADDGRLTYSWDFDGDGTVDSTAAVASYTYTTAGILNAALTVTDTLGATNTTTLQITPGNAAPSAVIDTPAPGTRWAVGDQITFSGHGTDLKDGTLAASRLTWHLRMQHCVTATVCHVHNLQDFTGVSGGSFVAPDHEYPSYLELILVAQDSDGLTNTVVRRLDPKTVTLTFGASRPGLRLVAGAYAGVAPFTRTVIQGSAVTLSAPSPQWLDTTRFTYARWSDGGAQTHVITASSSATYNVSYSEATFANLAPRAVVTADSSCSAATGPERAVDGNVATGWCSTGSDRWLRMDLGGAAVLSGFVVRHAGAGGAAAELNTRDFTIQVSVDGTTWSTPVTVAGNTANVTTHPVAVTGRYVRLRVTTPSSNADPSARIAEFEVFGMDLATPPAPRPPVDLARLGVATSDSSCSAAEGPERAVDGSVASGWCSGGSDRWLMVDLGSVAFVSGFVVRHAGAGGGLTALNTRDFTIQVSTDATTWSTPVSVAGNTANVTTHSVSVKGRYVRLRVTTPSSNGDPSARIQELEVLGVGVAAPPAPHAPVNLARQGLVTSDSSCSAAEGPERAVDGSVASGWCSGGSDRWLMVDLGSVAFVSGFVVRHAGAGGGLTALNTRDFTIAVSVDGVTWSTPVSVVGNTTDVTTHSVSVTGRYVRLRVTTPASNGDLSARIAEFEVYAAFT
jgi:glucose/arabinose dehydrogenase